MTEEFQTNSELYVNRVILADDTSEEQVGKDTNPDSCLVRKGMSLGKCSRAYLLHSDSMHSAVSHEKRTPGNRAEAVCSCNKTISSADTFLPSFMLCNYSNCNRPHSNKSVACNRHKQLECKCNKHSLSGYL